MDRKLTTVVGLVLLVALSGCAGLTSTTAGTGDDPGLEQRIEVTAQGEATAEPDRATLHVAVTSTGDDPATVRDELAASDDEVRSALTDWGLEEDEIRTNRYDIYETRETREDVDRTVYEGVHEYAIEIDDVDAVGEVIDVAVDAGADEVQRVQFGLSEEREREVRATALEKAVANAEDDAGVLANSSGLEVTGAYTVSTAQSRARPYVAETLSADAGDGGAATGIETGDVSVQVTVDVVYEAQPA
ncbi:DUF541 domain-containing protein [Halorubrum sp. CBA1125]|uniref:SIMPL domain-containing protein n=1 Tax=Halorubrum sp. CBA1125 TaxID=2668072 RepID=UPI0012E73B7F|nr:SIMPL domain-containing protein [Halorubrum sp. CBA1125]MUW14369.1 DUF541 domain-containing protein [Halorubrum sp. CBA1125]